MEESQEELITEVFLNSTWPYRADIMSLGPGEWVSVLGRVYSYGGEVLDVLLPVEVYHEKM